MIQLEARRSGSLIPSHRAWGGPGTAREKSSGFSGRREQDIDASCGAGIDYPARDLRWPR